jgi:hypothetical protein
MKKKLIAILPYEPPWQYYTKYKRFLQELDHPFLDEINFYVDKSLSISQDVIKKYDVVIFYYHDPLKQLYPDIYKYAKNIESFCDANGITFINKPDTLSNSSKSTQLNLLSKGGFTVAKSHLFKNDSDLLKQKNIKYPIFIRHDSGHDSLAEGVSDIIYSDVDLSRIFKKNEKKLEDNDYLKGLVALGWIDTKSSDGFYRKYRVFVFGNFIIRGPLQISQNWFVHSENIVKRKDLEDENKKFMCGKVGMQESDYFAKVNNVLDLDFSAIDYSYDKSGNIVIWEANPHPSLGEWAENNSFKKAFVENLSNFYKSKL